MFIFEYFIAHIPLICGVSLLVGLLVGGIVRYTLRAICGE